MMSKKYRIDTDRGSFIVETDEPDSPALLQSRQAASQGEFDANQPQSTIGTRSREAAIGALEPFSLGNVAGSVGSLGSALGDAITGKGTSKMQEMVKVLINAPVQPVKDWASGLMQGDYDKATYGSGGMLSQTAPAVAGVAAAADPLVAALEKRFPSKAAAEAKFNQVMAAAKDVPLDLTQADDIALRAMELGGKGKGFPGRGSTMPKVLKDYIAQREVSPQMTYEVGADIRSAASKLSAKESKAMTGAMKHQVNEFADAMRANNREAAAKMGVGEVFDQAMADYAKAMTNAERVAKLKKWGTRAGIVWALGNVGRAGWDAFN